MTARTRETVLLLLLAFGLATLSCTLFAESVRDPRPVFLRHMVHFVHWPAESFAGDHSPLVICIATSLALPWVATLAETRANGRPLHFSSQVRGRDDLDSCHVLLLDKSSLARIGALLRPPHEPRAMLTVGEGEELFGEGVMIVFERSGGKLEFNVDLASMHRHGLRMSARMLHMAREVRRP